MEREQKQGLVVLLEFDPEFTAHSLPVDLLGFRLTLVVCKRSLSKKASTVTSTNLRREAPPDSSSSMKRANAT